MQLLRNEAIFKKYLLKETREIHGKLTALTSQKSEKHAWFEAVKAKYARMRIMHIATENMWFLRKVRKPFLKPFINIITVMSHQLKKKR